MNWISWTILFFLGCIAIFFMLVAIAVDYPDEVELSDYTPEQLMAEINQRHGTKI